MIQEYIVQGDGQFTIHVMKPADRDKALAKRVKVKIKSKMEHKLELEDQSKRINPVKRCEKSDKQDKTKTKTPDKKDESK